MIAIKRSYDTKFYPNTERFDVLASNRLDQIIGMQYPFQPHFGYEVVSIFFALKNMEKQKKTLNILQYTEICYH